MASANKSSFALCSLLLGLLVLVLHSVPQTEAGCPWNPYSVCKRYCQQFSTLEGCPTGVNRVNGKKCICSWKYPNKCKCWDERNA